jgi:hypothetical protein
VPHELAAAGRPLPLPIRDPAPSDSCRTTRAADAPNEHWVVPLAQGGGAPRPLAQVLVVARFRRAAASRLRRAGLASVVVGHGKRAAVPAKIVSVRDSLERGASDDAGSVRVVLRMTTAPAEARWPGAPASVEV